MTLAVGTTVDVIKVLALKTLITVNNTDANLRMYSVSHNLVQIRHAACHNLFFWRGNGLFGWGKTKNKSWGGNCLRKTIAAKMVFARFFLRGQNTTFGGQLPLWASRGYVPGANVILLYGC